MGRNQNMTTWLNIFSKHGVVVLLELSKWNLRHQGFVQCFKKRSSIYVEKHVCCGWAHSVPERLREEEKLHPC